VAVDSMSPPTAISGSTKFSLRCRTPCVFCIASRLWAWRWPRQKNSIHTRIELQRITNRCTLQLRVRLMQQILKHEIARMTKRVIWGVVS
jgi:hypothetical protein